MRTDLDIRRLVSLFLLCSPTGSLIQSTRPCYDIDSPITNVPILLFCRPKWFFLLNTGRFSPGRSSSGTCIGPTHPCSSQPPQITFSSSIVGVSWSRNIKRPSFLSVIAFQLSLLALSFHAVSLCELRRGSAGQPDQHGSYLGLGNDTSVRGICTCCWD